MLIAWTDLDLSRDMESIQQILHEPLHGNVNIPQNTKISRLMGFQVNLVQDIWDFKTNDFKPFVGLITNGIFRRHYNQIKDNFPRQWVRILKYENIRWRIRHHRLLLQNDNILTDVQNTTTKDLYTAILTETNTDVQWKLTKPIPDYPRFLSIFHVYSLCFKILLKPNLVYYGYRIDFLPQRLNFFVK